MVPGVPEFVRKWNSRYAYPKMILTTFPDYFRYIDQHFGSVLETVVGDFGPYWEDGLGTDAHYVAVDRFSQQWAPSAEKLATLATYLQKDVAGPKESLRQMWEDLVLYAEHTFTSWGRYPRPESEETVRQMATKDHFAMDPVPRKCVLSIASLAGTAGALSSCPNLWNLEPGYCHQPAAQHRRSISDHPPLRGSVLLGSCTTTLSRHFRCWIDKTPSAYVVHRSST
ncbi:MAG: hypothetical protein ABSF45_17465 [Terriglobia bacterium]|jgi:hypothetical protein